MKIAGITSDTEESEEIEDIIKIFFISKRMKNISYQYGVQRKRSKAALKIPEKIAGHYSFIPSKFSLFSVRGIN